MSVHNTPQHPQYRQEERKREERRREEKREEERSREERKRRAREGRERERPTQSIFKCEDRVFNLTMIGMRSL